MLAYPVQIVLAEGGPRDQHEPIVREPRDGQVAFDATLLIKHLGIRHRTRPLVHFVVTQALQDLQCPAPNDLELAKRRQVEQRRARAASHVLGADGGKRGGRGPQKRDGLRSLCVPIRRDEKVWPLPCIFFAEHRTQLLQPPMHGTQAEIPGRLSLLVWVMDVIVRSIDFVHASQRVRLARVMRAESANVHAPQVEVGAPVRDPLRHHPPHTARVGDAVRAKPRGHEVASHLGRFAEDELAVRRERFRPVDAADDFSPFEARRALERIIHDLLEAAMVGLEQFVVEVGWDAL